MSSHCDACGRRKACDKCPPQTFTKHQRDNNSAPVWKLHCEHCGRENFPPLPCVKCDLQRHWAHKKNQDDSRTKKIAVFTLGLAFAFLCAYTYLILWFGMVADGSDMNFNFLEASFVLTTALCIVYMVVTFTIPFVMYGPGTSVFDPYDQLGLRMTHRRQKYVLPDTYF